MGKAAYYTSMLNKAPLRGLRVTRETWIAQLLYVGLSLIFLWTLLQNLTISSVSAYNTHLFVVGYILLMIVSDIIWRLAFARRRYMIVGITIFITALMSAGAAQAVLTSSAHDSLGAYSRFRGCTQLLTQSASKATCRLESGAVITMVKDQGKWYLEGDGPGQW